MRFALNMHVAMREHKLECSSAKTRIGTSKNTVLCRTTRFCTAIEITSHLTVSLRTVFLVRIYNACVLVWVCTHEQGSRDWLECREW